MAPQTAKIHTLITLDISIRTRPLVLKTRKRCPCGFDSHRPLHFQASLRTRRDTRLGINTLILWESVGNGRSIWRRSRVLRCPYAAPAFTRAYAIDANRGQIAIDAVFNIRRRL